MGALGLVYAGAKVLVIDDDPQAVGILQPLLLSKGFSVTVARDGVEGLEKIKLSNPDIILSDVNMPRMDGLEVCRRVKRDISTRIIPIILLTAYSDLEKKLEAIEAGADDFVNKPYNTIELLTRLQSLIRVKYLNEQLDNAEDVLFTMARAIEAKDTYTQGHVERVSRMAMRLGKHLNLSEDEQDSLRKGGILHDIGKIGVPDNILNKAGPLTTDERNVIRLHPTQGATICEKLKTVRGAIPIIRHHHERMDGSGYPDHLASEQIPLLARVMTIVDIYDALTTTRSYREALPHGEAIKILWQEARSGWWDTEILREFEIMLGKGQHDARTDAHSSPVPAAS